ncbi:MAG TPA: glycosyltransferase family 4 protein [Stellaceae bacterium]|nr:glycosyltransferase family 4 protein [Stellaceae bacterium]
MAQPAHTTIVRKPAELLSGRALSDALASMPATALPRRVALFCDFLSALGGTEYYNATLATALCERGIDVRIFVGEKPRLRHWMGLLEARGIGVTEPSVFHQDPWDRTIEKRFVRDIVESFAGWRPDIIHAVPPGKLLVSWFETRGRPEIPLVTTEWTTPSKITAHWYPPELPSCVHEVAAFIATCQAEAAGITAFHGYPGPVHLIEQLVAPLTGEQPLAVDPTNLAIGCISRFSVEKGLDYLLGAWAQIHAAIPQASLHLYGHGPDEARLRSLTLCLGIGDSVHFEGTYPPYGGIDDVAARHTVFIQPSLFEGLPVVLVELLARGRAIIATGVGGVPELLGGPPPAGVLIPAGNTEAIAAAVRSLLADPAAMKAYSLAGREVYARRYDADKILAATLEVYRSALAEQMPPCAEAPPARASFPAALDPR